MVSLYETHLHTREGSACGVSRGREYVKKYQQLGYAGIIITDHFFKGNCAVDRRLSWENWVHAFCRGYENAREEGARRGLDVFFGWEETLGGDDYLVYGLDKEWLLKHPEAARWNRKEQFEEVRRYGGCVVQAHPFRQRSHISSARLSSGYVDAVEAGNAGNSDPSCDALAWAYARQLGLPVTAGSDIHLASDVRPGITFGVYMDKRIESVGDYVEAIRNNTIKGLKVPPGSFTLYGNG
ncbi:MAG: PHP domain-containing protein [Treponema sp.]|nr:PHP domain-containing protein [Treponema sp.]